MEKRGGWFSVRIFADYKFSGRGPAIKGTTNSVGFAGSAFGNLWEDDTGTTSDTTSLADLLTLDMRDDDDLIATASVNMEVERVWTINSKTGKVTPPVMDLELPRSASPGSGGASVGVSFGKVIGTVLFDYDYVKGTSVGIDVGGKGLSIGGESETQKRERQSSYSDGTYRSEKPQLSPAKSQQLKISIMIQANTDEAAC